MSLRFRGSFPDVVQEVNLRCRLTTIASRRSVSARPCEDQSAEPRSGLARVRSTSYKISSISHFVDVRSDLFEARRASSVAIDIRSTSLEAGSTKYLERSAL